MPEETPNPGGAPNPGAAPPPDAGGDKARQDAAFAQMRTDLATQTKRNDELAASLKELERKDMDEKTRLAAELEDLRKLNSELLPLREQHGSLKSGIEAECEAALAKLPDDKRDTVRKATEYAPLDQRLSAIRALSEIVAPPAPGRAGTQTQPNGAPAPGPGRTEIAPLDVKAVDNLSWKDAVMSQPHAGENLTSALVSRIAEMERQILQLTSPK